VQRITDQDLRGTVADDQQPTTYSPGAAAALAAYRAWSDAQPTTDTPETGRV
jgi:hypothetical protein